MYYARIPDVAVWLDLAKGITEANQATFVAVRDMKLIIDLFSISSIVALLLWMTMLPCSDLCVIGPDWNSQVKWCFINHHSHRSFGR